VYEFAVPTGWRRGAFLVGGVDLAILESGFSAVWGDEGGAESWE
jgi:hypothetical protein